MFVSKHVLSFTQRWGQSWSELLHSCSPQASWKYFHHVMARDSLCTECRVYRVQGVYGCAGSLHVQCARRFYVKSINGKCHQSGNKVIKWKMKTLTAPQKYFILWYCVKSQVSSPGRLSQQGITNKNKPSLETWSGLKKHLKATRSSWRTDVLAHSLSVCW